LTLKGANGTPSRRTLQERLDDAIRCNEPPLFQGDPEPKSPAFLGRIEEDADGYAVITQATPVPKPNWLWRTLRKGLDFAVDLLLELVPDKYLN
jgi:hypothetical protein